MIYLAVISLGNLRRSHFFFVCVLGSGKYVFDRELADQKMKEGEEHVHHDLEKFKDKLVQRGVNCLCCLFLKLAFFFKLVFFF